MLAYRPLEAKGLWEWNDQQNPSLSSIVAAEGIRAMDIAPDRIVLAALESGHYVVKKGSDRTLCDGIHEWLDHMITVNERHLSY